MGSQQYLLNIPKTNTQIFGSNSRKIKSTKDWNELILSWKVGTFNKFDKFINLSNLLKVPTFHDRINSFQSFVDLIFLELEPNICVFVFGILSKYCCDPMV